MPVITWLICYTSLLLESKLNFDNAMPDTKRHKHGYGYGPLPYTKDIFNDEQRQRHENLLEHPKTVPV